MDITKRLEEHWKTAIKYGLNEDQIIGVFLYGSQNYGLDTPESDVDSFCLYVPTFGQLCLRLPSQTELHLPGGEHCLLLDIRSYSNIIKKQNANSLEPLFTKYALINPEYKEKWDLLIAHREEISRLDERRAVLSRCGQIHSNLSKNVTGKDLANSIYIVEFIEKYLAGESLENCYYVSDEEERLFLQGLKRVEDVTGSDIVKKTKEKADMYFESYKKEKHDSYNRSIENLLDQVVVNLIEDYCVSHLKQEKDISKKTNVDFEI